MTLPLRLSERKILLFIADLMLINLATFIAFWVHTTLSGSNLDIAFLKWRGLFPLLSIFWSISLLLNDLYNLSKTSDFIAGARSLALATALVIVAYTAIFFFTSPPQVLLRKVVLYQAVIGFTLVGTWRLLFGFLMRNRTFSRKGIIVGAGWAGKTIAEALYRYVTPHYRILGFVDDDPAKQKQMIVLNRQGLKANKDIRFPVLGASCDLKRIVEEHGVAEIVLAITHNLRKDLVEALLDCQSLGVQVSLMPALYEKITGRVPIQHIGSNWYVALPLEHPGTSGIYPILKRLFDIIGALIGLILYAPLFPFLALAIYIDSPGPIFYLQERIGKGGKIFRLIKLRTMVKDAEAKGPVWASKNDSRITRVGKFLRKTRLDEFPQLINVLKGDLSAVGPRAERPELISKIETQIPLHRLRTAIKPGMAGWAQVNYGYVDSVEDARIRLEYDLYYIKHQSLWLDILIILKMIGKILMLKGR